MAKDKAAKTTRDKSKGKAKKKLAKGEGAAGRKTKGRKAAGKGAKAKAKGRKGALSFCPCCSKHCPLAKPRCSKGRRLAEKLA